MSQLIQAEQVLAAVSQLVEQPLAFSAQGQATLALEQIPFTFSFSEAYPALFCQAEIGPVDTNDTALMEKLLQANHLWSNTAGGVLGIDPARAWLCLSWRVDLPLAEGEAEALMAEALPHWLGAALWAKEALGLPVPD